MRSQKTVLKILRGITALIEDEANRNPDFASRLDAILQSAGEPRRGATRTSRTVHPGDLPDVYAEWNARGEADFRAWLVGQSVEILRAIIQKHDLDAARRTHKWKDPEKLSGYVADQIQARVSRGSGFLRRSDQDE